MTKVNHFGTNLLYKSEYDSIHSIYTCTAITKLAKFANNTQYHNEYSLSLKMTIGLEVEHHQNKQLLTHMMNIKIKKRVIFMYIVHTQTY